MIKIQGDALTVVGVAITLTEKTVFLARHIVLIVQTAVTVAFVTQAISEITVRRLAHRGVRNSHVIKTPDIVLKDVSRDITSMKIV